MNTRVSLPEALRLGHVRPVVAALCQSFQAGLTPYPDAMAAVQAAARHAIPGEAISLCQTVLKKRPLDNRSWRLALVGRKQMSDWAGALEAVEQCFRLGDDAPELRLNQAFFLEVLDRPERALEILERSWSAEHAFEVEAIRAKAMLRQKRFAEVIERLSTLLDKANSSENIHLAGCWKSLGQAYDQSGQFDKAFHCFQKGNEVSPGLPPGQDTMPLFLQAWQQVATADWVASWSAVASMPARTPVFLIGFPRSGTTLLEQMLDAHPRVQALEEKPAIEKTWDLWLRMAQVGPSARKGLYQGDDLKRLVSILAELATLTDGEAEALRNRYFEVVADYIRLERQSVFVDKMPLNYLYIPFILRLFPDARFIFALRDPADCVLSGFMQHFTANPAMIRMRTLASGAAFYADSMNLLARYREIFDLESRLCFVRYESVLQDWQGEACRVLDFIGVGWDPAVAEYRQHAQQRGTISTPSYQAVTRPVDARAAGRWRRYEQLIGDDFKALEPFREQWGYR